MGVAVENHKEIGAAVEGPRFLWNTFVLRILSFLYYFNILHLFYGAGCAWKIWHLSLWNDNSCKFWRFLGPIPLIVISDHPSKSPRSTFSFQPSLQPALLPCFFQNLAKKIIFSRPASLGRNWEDADRPVEGRRSRLVKDFFTLLDPDNKQLLRPIGPSLGGCGEVRGGEETLQNDKTLSFRCFQKVYKRYIQKIYNTIFILFVMQGFLAGAVSLVPFLRQSY